MYSKNIGNSFWFAFRHSQLVQGGRFKKIKFGPTANNNIWINGNKSACRPNISLDFMNVK